MRAIAGGGLTTLPPGRLIPGTRYRVLGRLGEGAMGAVYAAEHIDLEKKVALKTLLAPVAQNPKAVERFRQEARAASKIGSPFICDVTDFGSLPDGQLFFVMELLEGRSLRRLLEAEGALPAPRAVPILRQVAKALGAAHEKRIIHLDVKPDNVMLMRRGRRDDAVKVVDFGIAGLLDQRVRTDTRDEKINGTPEYIPPERIRGLGYDHRSDIYSLGALAYEMLTGSCPFVESEIVPLLKKHLMDAPEPLRQRAAARGIPADLEALVLQMLEKDPEARPQSMAVVEAMLCEAQIAAGFSTEWDDLELPAVDEAWQRKLAERMPSPRARRLKRIAVAGSSMAVVAASAAIYFGLYTKKELIPVQVTVTQTEEASEGVARWLYKADEAVRANRHLHPRDTSALRYLENAEAEAARLGRPSPGAARLRQSYAGALALVGNQLLKAGLRDLAIVKFKEALLFSPEDPDLAAKAALTPEERRARVRAAPGASGAPAPAPPPPPPDEEAKRAAADLWADANDGRFAQARLRVKDLRASDRSGAQGARIADALRAAADGKWREGERDGARRLYEIVTELDPKDATARARAAPEPAPAAPPPKPVAVAAAPPPTAVPVPPPKPRRRFEIDDADDAPRDTAASRAAAAEGSAALARGQLAKAEEAFLRAIRADAGNPGAVGGLAEVAFERARYTEALDLARRATRFSPKSPKYQTILGDAYFKLLRYDEAVKAYERALALAPGDDAVKSRLRRLRAKLGH